jgi:hypothetical protein
MATYNIGIDKTYKAGMDLSNYQYGFVKFNSASKIVNASTLSGSVIGVLQNKPVSVDEEAVVRVFGFSKVRSTTEDAGSPIVAGNWVQCASQGWAAGLDLVNFGASQYAVGWATESASSGSGQWIEIFVKPYRFGL